MLCLCCKLAFDLNRSRLEKQKLETYKKHFHQNQLQLLERKRELKTKQKALNDVAKSLLKLQ